MHISRRGFTGGALSFALGSQLSVAALAQPPRRPQPTPESSRRQSSLVAPAARKPVTSAGAKTLAICQKASTGFKGARAFADAGKCRGARRIL